MRHYGPAWVLPLAAVTVVVLVAAYILGQGCNEQLGLTFENNTTSELTVAVNDGGGVTIKPMSTEHIGYPYGGNEALCIVARTPGGLVVYQMSTTVDALRESGTRISLDSLTALEGESSC